MRVTLDTNILVRATHSRGGPARQVVDEVTLPPHGLVLSEAILQELQRVLHYPRLRTLHGLDDAQIQDEIDALRGAAQIIVPVDLPASTPITPDPDDEVILGTAVAGSVDVLCTLDKHLRTTTVIDFCRQQGIRVLTDVELLQELQGASGAAP